MQGIVAALGSTWMQNLMNDYGWLWPVCETLHFMGMVLLIGTVVCSISACSASPRDCRGHHSIT